MPVRKIDIPHPTLASREGHIPCTTPLRIDAALATPGWMQVNELLWLAIQATAHHRIVELGSYLGRTTRALADNTPGWVLAIDQWPPMLNGVDLYEEFCRNVEEPFSASKLLILRGSHRDQDFSHPEGFDMVFIDGDHTYSGASTDIKMWQPRLSSGGLLCGHDIAHPEVHRAVTDIFGDKAVSIKGTNLWAVGDV